MSSSSLGRGIGAGTDGRDASEKHQRDFIPANVVTHEEVTEGHELLASEGLCEEIGGIVVGPDMEHFQQAVTHVVTYVVPARFESFVVLRHRTTSPTNLGRVVPMHLIHSVRSRPSYQGPKVAHTRLQLTATYDT